MTSNPSSCCSIRTACCEHVSIPDVLHAEISSEDCACLDGLAVVLTGSGTEWLGEVDNVCNGRKVTVRLSCEEFGGLFSFGGSLRCGLDADSLFPAPTDCQPFHVTFSLEGPWPDCGCDGNPVEVRVEITE